MKNKASGHSLGMPMKCFKSISILLILCLCLLPVKGVANAVLKTDQQADRVTVKGRVVDDSLGEPLIGVSISLKEDPSIGTISDIDGNFQILLSQSIITNGTLVVSYIGFHSQEVKINGKTSFTFRLKEATEALEEVVVVGYGVQKKVNLSGAVGVAKGDVLEDRPIGNAAQGLQGVIPNLNIDFNSGSPLAKTEFNIRGATSINGGGALVLVDGVETNDLGLLNPQDIESVSVLKDASSAAVYGARAAFGVILITTKSGKKGQKVQVNYNNNISWSVASRLPKSVRSDIWINAMNQANINNGEGAYFRPAHVAAVEAYVNDPLNNPYAFEDTTGDFTAKGQWAYAGNTDWFKEMYKTGFMHQHNASISGGSEKIKYYGSVGYKNQDGMLAFGTENYERINMAFNFDIDVTDWLEIGFRTKYNKQKADEPKANHTGGSPYYEVYRSFPFVPIYLPNGDWAGVEGSNFNYSMAGMLAQAGRDRQDSDDIWYTGSFKIKPIKGLSIQGDYTGNKFFQRHTTHHKLLYQSMPDPNADPLVKGSPSTFRELKHTNTYEALNLWASYERTIGDHTFNVMAGYNQESKELTRLATTTENLFLNDFPVSGLGTTYTGTDGNGGEWAVQGGFFRLNYNYMSKYLLEVNGRYDGSSRYPSGDRWGFFPSVSGAWRIGEEKFMENTRSWLDDLKLRVSVGALGNQVTNSYYQYLSLMSGHSINYVMGGKKITALTSPSLADTNITWEKVITSNVGIDLTLLNSRLTTSFDYFIRNTRDMVVAKAYPAVLGSDGGRENLANLRTNGWELSINWNDRIRDVAGDPLYYSFGVGISDSFSKITKYDNPTRSLGDLYEGKRLGEIWGYQTDGFIKDQAEADLMADRQSFISKVWIPGDIKYVDLDGDGKIDQGDYTVDNSGDLKKLGNTTPRYSFNINASANWKGFGLRLFFEGVMKRDVWIGDRLFWGYSGGIWHAALADYHVKNSWSEDKPNAYYPVPTWSDRSKQVQSKYLQNGAYIRLKDLTVSYTLPQEWLSTVGVEQFKVFFSGQNLWEATGLFKYLDPNMVGMRDSKGNLSGDDMKTYPFSRTYSIGFNVTF